MIHNAAVDIKSFVTPNLLLLICYPTHPIACVVDDMYVFYLQQGRQYSSHIQGSSFDGIKNTLHVSDLSNFNSNLQKLNT